jgi:hypothetical protein
MYDCLRSEEDGRKADNQSQTAHDCVTVTNPLADPTVQKQSDNLAHNDSVGQPGLPWCGDFPRAVWQLLAILLLELRKSEEVIEQTDIVAFHDNARADED